MTIIMGEYALRTQYIIDTLSDMRETITHILSSLSSGHNIDEAGLFNVRLVLNELITNAFLHGNACEKGRSVIVAVDRENDGSELTISVEDNGNGFDAGLAPVQTGATLKDHGRGLILVRALTRDMSFNERGNRICVRMSM